MTKPRYSHRHDTDRDNLETQPLSPFNKLSPRVREPDLIQFRKQNRQELASCRDQPNISDEVGMMDKDASIGFSGGE